MVSAPTPSPCLWEAVCLSGTRTADKVSGLLGDCHHLYSIHPPSLTPWDPLGIQFSEVGVSAPPLGGSCSVWPVAGHHNSSRLIKKLNPVLSCGRERRRKGEMKGKEPGPQFLWCGAPVYTANLPISLCLQPRPSPVILTPSVALLSLLVPQGPLLPCHTLLKICPTSWQRP